MGKISYRSGSLALAVSLGLAVLSAAHPSEAAVQRLADLNVNSTSASFYDAWSEASEKTQGETYYINLIDGAGNPRTFTNVAQGDVIFTEPNQAAYLPYNPPTSPGYDCRAIYANATLTVGGQQITGGALGTNPLASWWTQYGASVDGAAASLPCSDLVRFVNCKAGNQYCPNADQGQIWIIGDGAGNFPNDLANIPLLPANAQIPFWVDEGKAPWATPLDVEGAFAYSNRRWIQPVTGELNPFIVVRLQSDTHYLTATGYSDQLAVNVPALPTYGLVGMGLLLAGSGIVLMMRLRRESGVIGSST